ncbi:MAG: gamma-glutamyltransferase [Schleiferiaceae bacterium]|nr:gamma-glutamyltransferase [Schleiferiaceae bacterium]
MQGQGAVAAAHPIAVDVAKAILMQGGNAFDAAVATHFALAVVLPRAGNLGGGGFAVVRLADGQSLSLDYREIAPLAAHAESYLKDGSIIEGKSLHSLYASGIPGSVAGMWAMHDSLGSMPWMDLLMPAIELAEFGFPLTAIQALEINQLANTFRERNPQGAGPFTRGGWDEGSLFVQPDLAMTLRTIASEGPDGFYQGAVAEALVHRMREANQWITAEDLLHYQPHWREPLLTTYRGYDVVTMGPPSSGGVALIQMLQASERDGNRMQRHGSAAYAHDFTEICRLVYEDRALHLGDPSSMKLSTEALLDAGRLQDRFKAIPNFTSGKSKDLNLLIHTESEETTHLSIVDQQGHAIAITTTLNSSYGSKHWVAGFILNNEMDDFALSPGKPNQFGLVGFGVNAVGPGKRMLSSMTPTIASRSGHVMALGTPGGSTIITNVFQVLTNRLRYDMTLDEAVAKKKLHAQGWPGFLFVETDALSPFTKLCLRLRGHELKTRSQIGRFEAVEMIQSEARFHSSPDVSRQGDASGWPVP